MLAGDLPWWPPAGAAVVRAHAAAPSRSAGPLAIPPAPCSGLSLLRYAARRAGPDQCTREAARLPRRRAHAERSAAHSASSGLACWVTRPRNEPGHADRRRARVYSNLFVNAGLTGVPIVTLLTERLDPRENSMTKIRVYELAQELNVDSKQVMDALKADGEFVRSASSTLEPEAAQAVRERLWRQPAANEQAVRPDRRREPAPRREGWAAVPRPARRDQPSRTVAVSDLAPLERVIARARDEGPRITESRLELIRAEAHPWAGEWFTPTEAAPWIALRVSAADARRFCKLGITPEMLRLPLRMPGRAQGGGTMTYLIAFLRRDVTIDEIHAELVRTRHLPQARQVGEEAAQS